MSEEGTSFRWPSEAERLLVEKLLAASFPGNSELRAQFATAMVREVGPRQSQALELKIDQSLAPAQVRRRIPVEGEITDRDGIKVHLLLHVLNGYASELEVFREDGGALLRDLDAEDVRVVVYE